MISYQLNKFGGFANKLIDGQDAGVVVNVETDNEFLAWLAEGNTPNPYVPPPPPPELTPAEKLAAAGLTVDELKSLLGIK